MNIFFYRSQSINFFSTSYFNIRLLLFSMLVFILNHLVYKTVFGINMINSDYKECSHY